MTPKYDTAKARKKNAALSRNIKLIHHLVHSISTSLNRYRQNRPLPVHTCGSGPCLLLIPLDQKRRIVTKWNSTLWGDKRLCKWQSQPSRVSLPCNKSQLADWKALPSSWWKRQPRTARWKPHQSCGWPPDLDSALQGWLFFNSPLRTAGAIILSVTIGA